MMRGAIRAAGAPGRAVSIALIRVYRATLSGWLGGQCRFFPSCSDYAQHAIHIHGLTKGGALSIWRVLRCNPFGSGGPDPVPRASLAPYDGLILSEDAGADV